MAASLCKSTVMEGLDMQRCTWMGLNMCSRIHNVFQEQEAVHVGQAGGGEERGNALDRRL